MKSFNVHFAFIRNLAQQSMVHQSFAKSAAVFCISALLRCDLAQCCDAIGIFQTRAWAANYGWKTEGLQESVSR